MDRNLKWPDAVFFDWDGTLVDSYGFLNDAHNHVLGELNLPPLKDGEYAHYFGKPREYLYPKIYGDQSEKARLLFADYVNNNTHKTKEIEGAAALLSFLHNNDVVMGVVSNKHRSFIEREINFLQWGSYFKEVVGGGEATADKPSGEPLLLALDRADIDHRKKNILYIGDTENDLRCAAEVGCGAVLMHGYEDNNALIAHYKPVIAVKNCYDLHQILVAILQNSARKGT